MSAELRIAKDFIALKTEPLEWEDGGSIQELPPGPQVKILRSEPKDDSALDILVRFPPGYVEPRHTHPGEHSVLILEGTMIVDGKRLGPGDYVFGPRGIPHGPFEYPDGITLYAAHRGNAAHFYEGKTTGERQQEVADQGLLPHHDSTFLAVITDDVPWIDARELIQLPPGLKIKILRHHPEDDEARDLLVKFPPGYIEPRHTHPGEHNNVILSGRMLIDGKELFKGDYVFGPGGVPHGPFGYPDGIVLCAFHRGDPAHEYEGKSM
jgi:quercetin dioxygenase-like cupin family protein